MDMWWPTRKLLTAETAEQSIKVAEKDPVAPRKIFSANSANLRELGG